MCDETFKITKTFPQSNSAKNARNAIFFHKSFGASEANQLFVDQYISTLDN